MNLFILAAGCIVLGTPLVLLSAYYFEYVLPARRLRTLVGQQGPVDAPMVVKDPSDRDHILSLLHGEGTSVTTNYTFASRGSGVEMYKYPHFGCGEWITDDSLMTEISELFWHEHHAFMRELKITQIWPINAMSLIFISKMKGRLKDAGVSILVDPTPHDPSAGERIMVFDMTINTGTALTKHLNDLLLFGLMPAAISIVLVNDCIREDFLQSGAAHVLKSTRRDHPSVKHLFLASEIIDSTSGDYGPVSQEEMEMEKERDEARKEEADGERRIAQIFSQMEQSAEDSRAASPRPLQEVGK